MGVILKLQTKPDVVTAIGHECVRVCLHSWWERANALIDTACPLTRDIHYTLLIDRTNGNMNVWKRVWARIGKYKSAIGLVSHACWDVDVEAFFHKTPKSCYIVESQMHVLS